MERLETLATLRGYWPQGTNAIVRKHLVAAAVLTGILTAAGCSSEPANDGPLVLNNGAPVGSSELCSPATGGERGHTLSAEIENTGGESTLVTDVSLLESESAEIIEAVLVPIAEPDPQTGEIHSIPANGTGYPALWSEVQHDTKLSAYYIELEKRVWGARQPLVGSTIEPGDTWNMVLGVVATNVPARLKAVKVEYRDSSDETYESLSATSLSIKNDCR